MLTAVAPEGMIQLGRLFNYALMRDMLCFVRTLIMMTDVRFMSRRQDLQFGDGPKLWQRSGERRSCFTPTPTMSFILPPHIVTTARLHTSLEIVRFRYIGDRIQSRKSSMVIALIILLGSCIMFMLGRTIAVLIAGRIFQGLSAQQSGLWVWHCSWIPSL